MRGLPTGIVLLLKGLVLLSDTFLNTVSGKPANSYLGLREKAVNQVNSGQFNDYAVLDVDDEPFPVRKYEEDIIGINVPEKAANGISFEDDKVENILKPVNVPQESDEIIPDSPIALGNENGEAVLKAVGDKDDKIFIDVDEIPQDAFGANDDKDTDKKVVEDATGGEDALIPLGNVEDEREDKADSESNDGAFINEHAIGGYIPDENDEKFSDKKEEEDVLNGADKSEEDGEGIPDTLVGNEEDEKTITNVDAIPGDIFGNKDSDKKVDEDVMDDEEKYPKSSEDALIPKENDEDESADENDGAFMNEDAIPKDILENNGDSDSDKEVSDRDDKDMEEKPLKWYHKVRNFFGK